MQKRIIIKDKPEAIVVEKLKNALGVDDSIAVLLAQRGINSFDEAKKFFRPELTDLHDPFLMKDMDKAVDRLDIAILKDEKILVYGDYDVDGTTAVSIMYSFLRSFTSNILYYIPDRYNEGYGVSKIAIDFALNQKVSLVIALDCGIQDNEKIKYAKSNGIDFIVCDHHLPGAKLPEAFAVLDPKQKGCDYPFKELSGCGVGFKLIQGYLQKNNMPFSRVNEFLDLAAISISADIVPITGENRVLTYVGLQQINSNPRTGIKAILDLINLNRELNVNDVVFQLAPRINAAGRMDHGKKIVELLTTDNPLTANEIAIEVNLNNTDRIDHDMATTENALQQLNADAGFISRKTTVLYNENWSKGVIGIVASRLIEQYYRPTILFTQSNGKLCGSARSIKNVDIYEALVQCSQYIERFGGHKYAAGITLKMENFDLFKNSFEEVIARTITDDQLIPEIEIDAELSFDLITPKFYRILNQFAPFGPGNMRPVFITNKVVDTGYSKIVGSNQQHLKVSVKDKNSKMVMNGISFGMADKYELIKQGNPFSIIYNLDENTWNGKTEIQLNVREILVG